MRVPAAAAVDLLGAALRAAPKAIAGAALTVLSALAPARAEPPLLVAVAPATPAPTLRELHLVGTVEAAASHPAAFRSGGRILAIAVEVGDAVAAGEVLARLDDTQAQAALRAAQAALTGAEAQLAQAQAEDQRAQALLGRGVGTQAQLDDAEEALLAAQAARRQAEAQLQSAQQAVEDCVIRAARPAEVIARAADPGEVVGAGQPVLTLASSTEREALFLLPDLAGLERLAGVAVTLAPTAGGPEFAAQVTTISPVLSAAGTVAVRTRFAVAPASPALGSTVAARISVPAPALLQIPWTALEAEAAGPAVWLADPSGTARLVPIGIGSFTDTEIGVTEGLAQSDPVVAAGSQQLFPGRTVAAAEPESGPGGGQEAAPAAAPSAPPLPAEAAQ